VYVRVCATAPYVVVLGPLAAAGKDDSDDARDTRDKEHQHPQLKTPRTAKRHKGVATAHDEPRGHREAIGHDQPAVVAPVRAVQVHHRHRNRIHGIKGHCIHRYGQKGLGVWPGQGRPTGWGQHAPATMARMRLYHRKWAHSSTMGNSSCRSVKGTSGAGAWWPSAEIVPDNRGASACSASPLAWWPEARPRPNPASLVHVCQLLCMRGSAPRNFSLVSAARATPRSSCDCMSLCMSPMGLGSASAGSAALRAPAPRALLPVRSVQYADPTDLHELCRLLCMHVQMRAIMSVTLCWSPGGPYG
jgi:hypothetical protein